MQIDLTSPRSSASQPDISVPKPDLDLSRVLDCTVGHYPWDDWERWALAQGLEPRLAGLARLVIREAFQHDWPRWLIGVTGWADNGQGMLDLALRAPRIARRQWDILLRTDGLRGDYPPSRRSGAAGRARSSDWTWGYLRPAARRLCCELLASCDATHS